MTNAILRRQKFIVHKSWKSMMSIGYRASVYIIYNGHIFAYKTAPSGLKAKPVAFCRRVSGNKLRHTFNIKSWQPKKRNHLIFTFYV